MKYIIRKPNNELDLTKVGREIKKSNLMCQIILMFIGLAVGLLIGFVLWKIK